MDLPISIPRVSNTLSSQGPNYRLFICKIKRKWLEKENNYYGCSFDSIKTGPSSPSEAAAVQPMFFSFLPLWVFRMGSNSLPYPIWIYVFLFSNKQWPGK